MNTYEGLQDFGSVAIMVTTMATMAMIPARNTKNVHFRISGQSQCTKLGISLVRAMFIVPFAIPFSCILPSLFFRKCWYSLWLLNRLPAPLVQPPTMPMPELPDELVSAAGSSPATFSQFSTLPMLGVSGWVKSKGGLGVPGSSKHVDASSSGRKVDTDGDVVKDSGKSAPSSVGSVDIWRWSILFYYHIQIRYFWKMRSRENANRLITQRLSTEEFATTLTALMLAWYSTVFSWQERFKRPICHPNQPARDTHTTPLHFVEYISGMTTLWEQKPQHSTPNVPMSQFNWYKLVCCDERRRSIDCKFASQTEIHWTGTWSSLWMVGRFAVTRKNIRFFRKLFKAGELLRRRKITLLWRQGNVFLLL